MQRAILFGSDGTEVTVEVTVGAVEAISLLERGARAKTIKDKLRRYVKPQDAVESPIYFFKIIEAIAKALDYHQRRSEREPTPRERGPTPRSDAISEAFSTLKYAFAQKLHLSPLQVSEMYIDEAFDYIVMMKAEGRYYEKLQRSIGRHRIR